MSTPRIRPRTGFCRRIFGISAALGALTSTLPALPQPAEPKPETEKAPPEGGGEKVPETRPPRLIRQVEAEYPEGSHDDKVPHHVELELTISAEGKVTEAKVVGSSDKAFEAAAVSAAQRFVFEPARHGGKDVAVRIRYRYVFPAQAKQEPTPVETPEEVPAPKEPAVEEPAPDAPQEDKELELEAVAEVEAPRRGSTRRTLEGPALTRIPGTRGDPLRATEVMPGVARTEIDNGTPILRGAAGHQSETVLEGAAIPFLYHFGGATSIFQGRLIRRLDLYPSNFSVRYGRRVGGIIDVGVRDPLMDRFHAMVDLSLVDSAALVEAPLGSSTGIALAARRSNIDFVFENFVPEGAYSVVAAPVYYDYQAIGVQRIGADHTLRVMGYGSRDSIHLVFSDPNREDPTLRGQVEASAEFHRIQLDLKSQLQRELSQSLMAALSWGGVRMQVGPAQQDLHAWTAHGRGDWTLTASRYLDVSAGLDVLAEFWDGVYYGPTPGQVVGDPGSGEPMGNRRFVSLPDSTVDVVLPAAFIELRIKPSDDVELVPGVRADYFANIDAWTVNPRLNARARVLPQTTLKAGAGLFSQPPIFWQAMELLGNPEIEPYHALHLSLGVEQGLSKGIELGVEGFYKRLWNRVVPTEGSQPPRFVNDGVGRIYGAEVSLEAQPTSRTQAWVAYTLSRSELQSGNGPWQLFDQDQTHILSLAASQDLGAGWNLGGRFRLVSGNPDTPIEGAVYDASNNAYRPIYGEPFSTRKPMFHQMDVRIEKTWRWPSFAFSTYLDVSNVYNAQNEIGRTYSYDYSQSESVTGLPIFPNLGIRGEL